jgi:uncharacterized protein
MPPFTCFDQLDSTPGRRHVRLDVARDLSGRMVSIDVIVHQGTEDGPTLTLLSGMHGDEWLHLEFFRRIDAELDHAALRGRLIMVPIANAAAFAHLSRNVLHEADAPDMNRVFPVTPRPQNGLPEQLAAKLAHEVLTRSDALLDFHLGIWGSTLASSIVGIDFSDEGVRRASHELALTFGLPLVFETRMMSVFPGPRAAQAYVGEVLKIPSCGSFHGGAGFDADLEDGWMNANYRGIHNVMRHLGMEDGAIERPGRYLAYEVVQRVNPRNGGYLIPERRRDTFGREISEGDLLGRVTSPFTFETIEELRAPMDGYLGYWSRNYPLHPGDWAFSVVPRDHPGTRWIETD